MIRRRFLKGLCASAALAIASLVPDLALGNDWGFRKRPFRPEDYTIAFEYVPMFDGPPQPIRRFEIPASVLRGMADGGDFFAASIVEKHGRVTRVVSNARVHIFRPEPS